MRVYAQEICYIRRPSGLAVVRSQGALCPKGGGVAKRSPLLPLSRGRWELRSSYGITTHNPKRYSFFSISGKYTLIDAEAPYSHRLVATLTIVRWAVDATRSNDSLCEYGASAYIRVYFQEIQKTEYLSGLCTADTQEPRCSHRPRDRRERGGETTEGGT